ncbi:Transcription factor bHLH53 [Cardamine amara subsp. amara]|uniref:Transcription factor bHLH53 n=1 Tax=Cardamine amara subsp. amara TaxID=228776 RepID=A0ABD1ABA4_CARAN
MSMDCLSYFFNYDPPVQLQDCFLPEMDMIIPETDSFCFQSQPQLDQFQQPLFQEEAPSQTYFDPFCDQYLSPQEIFLPNPKPEIFNETHNLDSFLPTPKRQKLVNSSYQCNTHNHFQSHNPNFFDPFGDFDFVPEASIFPEFRVPDFSLAFKVGRGDQDDSKKPTLSSQSIAARERRRRIAEKTHELGKLIPGGQKLNTAEMFQAAAKYVKFLQSQVGILQLMQTKKKTQGSSNVEMETRILLESQAIQEKLSTEEVCLVPCEIIEDLTTDETIWRNPMISREINKLLSTDLAN